MRSARYKAETLIITQGQSLSTREYKSELATSDHYCRRWIQLILQINTTMLPFWYESGSYRHRLHGCCQGTVFSQACKLSACEHLLPYRYYYKQASPLWKMVQSWAADSLSKWQSHNSVRHGHSPHLQYNLRSHTCYCDQGFYYKSVLTLLCVSSLG